MTSRRIRAWGRAGIAAAALITFALPAVAADSSTPQARTRTRKVVVNGNDVLVKGDDESDHNPQARRLVEMLHGGYLGIMAVDLTPELRSHFGAPEDSGVLVGRVEPDSPADKAGLKVGDVLTRVAGEDVASSWDVRKALQDSKDGDTVEIEVLRDGRSTTLNATVKEREQARVDMGPLLWKQRSGKDGESWRLAPEVRIPAIQIPPIALENLQETLNSPDFREKLEAMQSNDTALRARLKALEERLKQLEQRLDESGRSR
jgi:membrane-associated protease RseP (regulator of RpoE activity)